MKHYMILAMALHFFVNCILLLAVEKITGNSVNLRRDIAGSCIGSIYAAACAVKRFGFLNGPVWYGMQLLSISVTAFGVTKDTFYKAVLFALLRICFDANGKNGFYYLIYILAAGTALLLISCNGQAKALFIPIELHYRQKTVKLTALRDTGNMLYDPVSGKPVMIVGADVAKELIGLTEKQLRAPVDVIGTVPGARLIPYKTVGETGKMLLALPVPNTRIDGKCENSVIAFAPMLLDEKGKYQALIGGI